MLLTPKTLLTGTTFIAKAVIAGCIQIETATRSERVEEK